MPAGADPEYVGPVSQVEQMHKMLVTVSKMLRTRHLRRELLFKKLARRAISDKGILLSRVANEAAVWQHAYRRAEELTQFLARVRALERRGEGFEARVPRDLRPDKRTCTKCGHPYPATTVYFRPHRKWLRSTCRACDREYNKAVYRRKKRERRNKRTT